MTDITRAEVEARLSLADEEQWEQHKQDLSFISPICAECAQSWPCDVSLLLDRLEAAERGVTLRGWIDAAARYQKRAEVAEAENARLHRILHQKWHNLNWREFRIEMLRKTGGTEED